MNLAAANRHSKSHRSSAALGTMALLFVATVPAYAADVEPITYWNRLQEKDALERVWEAFRLKLMTGAEYSVMQDGANNGGAFNGWTYFAGARVYF